MRCRCAAVTYIYIQRLTIYGVDIRLLNIWATKKVGPTRKCESHSIRIQIERWQIVLNKNFETDLSIIQLKMTVLRILLPSRLKILEFRQKTKEAYDKRRRFQNEMP